jgi:hypothetical protein
MESTTHGTRLRPVRISVNRPAPNRLASNRPSLAHHAKEANGRSQTGGRDKGLTAPGPVGGDRSVGAEPHEPVPLPGLAPAAGRSQVGTTAVAQELSGLLIAHKPQLLIRQANQTLARLDRLIWRRA